MMIDVTMIDVLCLRYRLNFLPIRNVPLYISRIYFRTSFSSIKSVVINT